MLVTALNFFHFLWIRLLPVIYLDIFSIDTREAWSWSGCDPALWPQKPRFESWSRHLFSSISPNQTSLRNIYIFDLISKWDPIWFCNVVFFLLVVVMFRERDKIDTDLSIVWRMAALLVSSLSLLITLSVGYFGKNSLAYNFSRNISILYCHWGGWKGFV